jgi:DNA (cytosine-5)-methyltransferase 1
MDDKKITYIDLFAGCGGLSEGFNMSDLYEGLAHVEWKLPMVQTLRNRLIKKYHYDDVESKKRVIFYDLQKTENLLKGVKKQEEGIFRNNNSSEFLEGGLDNIVKNKKVDLIIGGPPCQAYSIAGRAQDKNSMQFDYRNYLFESFAKIVDHYKPKMFVFENVGGILSASPGGVSVLERIYKSFYEIGYEIRKPKNQKKSLLNSNDFGVAQNRKRVIIIGKRISDNIELENIYAEIEKNKTPIKLSLKDAIGDLPKIFPKSANSNKTSHFVDGDISINDHTPRFHNFRDIEIFKYWIDKKMNNVTLQEKLNFYLEKTGKTSNHNKYRALEWNKPSPTIVSHLNKDGLMFIHPDSKQSRTITVREAARIQSFPDDFEFIGSMGMKYIMIGNAVPPNMAKQISISISKYL